MQPLISQKNRQKNEDNQLKNRFRYVKKVVIKLQFTFIWLKN